MTENSQPTNDSGLDTSLGSGCSRIAYHYAKQTFGNRKGKSVAVIPSADGGYSTALDVQGSRIGISSDGIGTKVEIAERLKKYDTLGFDLLAMTIDDLCCSGFIPAFVSNVLDADVLDSKVISELMLGLYEAANFADVIVTGGEIAELGTRIGGYGTGMHFNWCATGIGVLHKNLSVPISGTKIQTGDVILSAYNPGFRSNGFSLIRNTLKQHYGDNWHLEKTDKDLSWGESVLEPSLIYSPLVEHLLDEGIDIHGIAHITGGGIVDNLGRIIKLNGLGAELVSLWEPDYSMKRIIDLSGITREKAYRYFNMGNGMMFVIRKEDAEKALMKGEENNLYKMKYAGTVVQQKVITINDGDRTLSFTEYYDK